MKGTIIGRLREAIAETTRRADTPHHPERADLRTLTYRLQRLATLTEGATSKDELEDLYPHITAALGRLPAFHEPAQLASYPDDDGDDENEKDDYHDGDEEDEDWEDDDGYDLSSLANLTPEAKQIALAMLTGQSRQAIPARTHTLKPAGTLCPVCGEHGHNQSSHTTLDQLQTGTQTTPPPAVAMAAGFLRQHWYPKTRGLTAWRNRPTPNSRPR